ncbi:MAG: hypothetical protein SD837_11520 [Candidatus Electrothrix scaldis]|nr:MAG: hypothetical protein SD837_11520 [Candidatus Electrothrix sp. GW3-3]
MAGVMELTIHDNHKPANSTAQVTAGRIGNTLRTRFENYIHKDECNPAHADYDDKMISRSIGAFTAYHLGKIDEKTAGESVCDSSSDGGIDAICVNHSERLAVVIQSKFNKAGTSTWSEREFLHFKDACEKTPTRRIFKV